MTGNFATSKAGHDSGKYYVIVKEEGDFVYLSDGRLKPLSSPKRKRKKHIQIINQSVPEEMIRRLLHTDNPACGSGRNDKALKEGENGIDKKYKCREVRDEEIKYEIKKFKLKRIEKDIKCK